jgi:hypothetical protein
MLQRGRRSTGRAERRVAAAAAGLFVSYSHARPCHMQPHICTQHADWSSAMCIALLQVATADSGEMPLQSHCSIAQQQRD